MIHDESCFQQLCVSKGLCVILITGEDEDVARRAHSTMKEIETTVDEASLFAFAQIKGPENYEWVTQIFGDMDLYYSNVVVLSPRKKVYAHYVGSFETQSVADFIKGILTGRTRTAAVRVKEYPKLSTDTEKCKPPPTPPKKEKKKEKKDKKTTKVNQLFIYLINFFLYVFFVMFDANLTIEK